MSRLTRAIKEEIAKEILKGFKLKTPEEFAKEIEAIRDEQDDSRRT